MATSPTPFISGIFHDAVVPAPAIPAAPGATVVMFSSSAYFGSGSQMRARLVHSIEVGWLQLDQPSAAAGFRAYGSVDGGATWIEVSMPDDSGTDVMPQTVAALAAGKNVNYRFIVTNFDDFKVEFTAAAAAPATWKPVVIVHYGPSTVTV